jgi:hypothetical protein
MIFAIMGWSLVVLYVLASMGSIISDNSPSLRLANVVMNITTICWIYWALSKLGG